jgi:hypothetical protein
LSDRVSNIESDAELKKRAMDYILREVCKKYRDENDPIFTSEEVKKRLRGLGPRYIDLNMRDIFRGSGLIEIDDNYNLTLNDRGIESCERGGLLD